MILTFPWPPKELSPNARVHWAALSRAKKKYKDDCIKTCWAHGLAGVKKDTWGFGLHIEFVPPDNRRRDKDNCIASFKAGQDAIAHVLGIDDNLFQTTHEMAAHNIPDGAVVVNLRWSSPRSPQFSTHTVSEAQ